MYDKTKTLLCCCSVATHIREHNIYVFWQDLFCLDTGSNALCIMPVCILLYLLRYIHIQPASQASRINSSILYSFGETQFIRFCVGERKHHVQRKVVRNAGKIYNTHNTDNEFTPNPNHLAHALLAQQWGELTLFQYTIGI